MSDGVVAGAGAPAAGAGLLTGGLDVQYEIKRSMPIKKTPEKTMIEIVPASLTFHQDLDAYQ